jgi:hypothetical protein
MCEKGEYMFVLLVRQAAAADEHHWFESFRHSGAASPVLPLSYPRECVQEFVSGTKKIQVWELLIRYFCESVDLCFLKERMRRSFQF